MRGTVQAGRNDSHKKRVGETNFKLTKFQIVQATFDRTKTIHIPELSKVVAKTHSARFVHST